MKEPSARSDEMSKQSSLFVLKLLSSAGLRRTWAATVLQMGPVSDSNQNEAFGIILIGCDTLPLYP